MFSHVRITALWLCALLVTTAGLCRAAIPPDLSYVDTTTPAYARFKAWVDRAVAGNPGYNFSATDAGYAYRLNGNAAYCQLAVRMAEKQVADAEAVIANGQRPEVSGDSYLHVGEMIRDVSLTYDWCDAFTTTQQRARWAAYAEQAVWNVWHHQQANWGGRPFPWSGWSVNDPGNNYYYSFIEATMYWAMASGSTDWRQFLEQEKLPPLVSYFAALPGGGSSEGTGYGLSHQRLFELYRIWRDYTGTDLGAQSTHLTDSIDWWIHATVPTLDRIAPLGDQSRVSYPDLYDYHRNVILQARAMTGSVEARSHANWWLNHISVAQMDSGFNFRHDLLPSSGAAAPPSALYYHAAGTGRLFARSSWSTGAMWLGFTAGPYEQGHAAQDQGAFTLFARDFLAVTENIFTHSGIQQGTAVQNVLRFTSNGSDIPQRYPTLSSMTVTPGANGVLDVSANLTPAYDGHPAIQSWRRDLHFAQRKLSVHDTYQVGSGVQTVFQVNTPLQPVISGNSARAGDLIITVLKPANATLRAIDWHATGPASEYLRGWKLEVGGASGEFLVEFADAHDSLCRCIERNPPRLIPRRTQPLKSLDRPLRRPGVGKALLPGA
ncbi:hypothetical protein [Luteimonas panaciterrae]|uniref:hypothetical protein n=1 Tax=Luteimonas panaciterrae TaxID=363885 RepID=UPI001CFA0BC6|nr:hypothetical protein [Luteimonas panaciterrae]